MAHHDVKVGDEFAVGGWGGPIRKVTAIRKNGNVVLDGDVRAQWVVWDKGAKIVRPGDGWKAPSAYRITPETMPIRERALLLLETRKIVLDEIERLTAIVRKPAGDDLIEAAEQIKKAAQ